MSSYSECCDISSCAPSIKLLRIQKHDFLNHLQIIHSLIKLERTEEALNYIEKISYDDAWILNVLAEYNKENNS
jgi:sensor histidine kinase regulating citrate/malate metabolism